MPEYGDLVRTGRTPSEVRVHSPQQCRNGHRLAGNGVLSTTRCTCRAERHQTWTCRQCEDVQYGPPLTDACRPNNAGGSMYG